MGVDTQDWEQAQARIAQLEAELAQLQAQTKKFRSDAEKYYHLYQYSSDSIFIIEVSTGAIIDANPDAARRLGYPLEELIGLPLSQIEIQDDSWQAQSTSSWRSAISGTHVYECRYRAKDGSLIPVEVSSRLITIEGRDLIQNTVRNISRRKRLEERLRIFERAVEQSANTIVITDTRGNIEYVNPKFVHLTGYSREEAYGQNPRILKSGQTDPAVHRELWQSLVEGKEWVGEFINMKKNGELYWEQAVISPIRNATGIVTHYLAVKEDITARKMAEAERERLIEELDAFSHTVAHDLKNPLAVLMGFTEMLLDELSQLSQEEIYEMLLKLHQTEHKLNNIINELLLLARVRELAEVTIEPLDMPSIVAEALKRLQDLVESSSAQIVLQDEGTWQIAVGHASWVEEVWANYISNAIKYGGTPPQITIGSTPEEDGSIRFWVRDNGPGIASEDIPDLFQRFSRLEMIQAEGHGLGLSIVQRIVSRLKGKVSVQSAPGEGSIFSFTLPAYQ
ncbi:two-component system, OmpR family, sensor histidine kinase VicK [Anaerolineae bacterium]|nr:two-component system, OmpR family, sensor histidine kinase VicK [Anaerolineae bacterium]